MASQDERSHTRRFFSRKQSHRDKAALSVKRIGTDPSDSELQAWNSLPTWLVDAPKGTKVPKTRFHLASTRNAFGLTTCFVILATIAFFHYRPLDNDIKHTSHVTLDFSAATPLPEGTLAPWQTLDADYAAFRLQPSLKLANILFGLNVEATLPPDAVFANVNTFAKNSANRTSDGAWNYDPAVTPDTDPVISVSSTRLSLLPTTPTTTTTVPSPSAMPASIELAWRTSVEPRNAIALVSQSVAGRAIVGEPNTPRPDGSFATIFDAATGESIDTRVVIQTVTSPDPKTSLTQNTVIFISRTFTTPGDVALPSLGTSQAWIPGFPAVAQMKLVSITTNSDDRDDLNTPLPRTQATWLAPADDYETLVANFDALDFDPYGLHAPAPENPFALGEANASTIRRYRRELTARNLPGFIELSTDASELGGATVVQATIEWGCAGPLSSDLNSSNRRACS